MCTHSLSPIFSRISCFLAPSTRFVARRFAYSAKIQFVVYLPIPEQPKPYEQKSVTFIFFLPLAPCVRSFWFRCDPQRKKNSNLCLSVILFVNREKKNKWILIFFEVQTAQQTKWFLCFGVWTKGKAEPICSRFLKVHFSTFLFGDIIHASKWLRVHQIRTSALLVCHIYY